MPEQPDVEPRIAVVIPARNEAAVIGRCLRSLEPFRAAGDRIVVVDAGSTDATAARAAEHGAIVVRGPRERGLAIAAGYAAECDRARVLLIAHADMRFAPESRRRLLDGLAADAAAVGGALGHVIDDARRRFRLLERGNRFRAAVLQLPYGDQAMFVRTAAVRAAGGFPRLAALEDLELALRLRRIGRWLMIDCPVTIDARHWRRGVVRTTVQNWLVALRHVATRRRAAPGWREQATAADGPGA
jgi:glycosyltransferase involved in cell wall biosynthesis